MVFRGASIARDVSRFLDAEYRAATTCTICGCRFDEDDGVDAGFNLLCPDCAERYVSEDVEDEEN